MTVAENRHKELDLLLEQMRAMPSREWDKARERAVVLSQLVGREASRLGR